MAIEETQSKVICSVFHVRSVCVLNAWCMPLNGCFFSVPTSTNHKFADSVGWRSMNLCQYALYCNWKRNKLKCNGLFGLRNSNWNASYVAAICCCSRCCCYSCFMQFGEEKFMLQNKSQNTMKEILRGMLWKKLHVSLFFPCKSYSLKRIVTEVKEMLFIWHALLLAYRTTKINS